MAILTILAFSYVDNYGRLLTNVLTVLAILTVLAVLTVFAILAILAILIVSAILTVFNRFGYFAC